MSDENDTAVAATPTDEKVEAPVAVSEPEAGAAAVASADATAPEAEAGIAEETAPDPEHAPETELIPPEVAEGTAVADQVVAEAESATDEPTKKAKSKAKSKAKRAEVAEEAEPEPTAEQPVPGAEPVAEGEPTAEPKPENKKKWYAVKVQSGREDTIKSAILRKVAIEGLEEYFGEIAIPFEEVIEKKPVRVKNKKTGEYEYQEKKVTKRKKKFHGYIFANVEFNDRILYLFRETSGVGDFLNVRGQPGNPTAEPMPDHEVQAMLTGIAVKDPNKKVKFKLDFEKGDKVRIREGAFANAEGEVKGIIEAKDPTDVPKITVTVTLWGRPVDVDLDANQVEKP